MIMPGLTSFNALTADRAALKCSNQAGPSMTLTDPIAGFDSPKRPLSTPTDLVCIQEVSSEPRLAARFGPASAAGLTLAARPPHTGPPG